MRFSCVLELDKRKWEIARDSGAGEIIDPNAEGALKSLMKATGGVAAAIDFIGAAATFNFGFQALRKAGKLVCVGLFGGSSQVVPGRWRYARARADEHLATRNRNRLIGPRLPARS